MKKILWIMTAAIALTAAAEEKKAQAAPQQPPVAVRVETVTLQRNSATKKYVGHLKAIEEVALPARVSGVLKKICFTEGEMVKKGQLLFEIEDTTYLAKARQAEAQLRQIEVELDFAKSNFKRQKELKDSEAVSAAVYEEALRLLRGTEAKLTAAKASKLDADNELSYTRIEAPITGRIGKSAYSVGNYVTPASGNLADIVQITPIYVEFALSERDYLELFGNTEKMRKEALVQLKLSDGQIFEHTGSITLVDNRVDSGTGTITVWATVENPAGRLMPGGFATVLLSNRKAPEEPAIILSALLTDNQGSFVYVLDKDNKAVRRNVTAGNIIEKWQFIREGLSAGEKIIVDGTHKVRPGAPVLPVEAK